MSGFPVYGNRKRTFSEAALRRKDCVGEEPQYDINLQHRHFKFIAAVIARLASPEARNAAYEAFAYWCGKSNANFDRDRFYTACRLEDHMTEHDLDVEIAQLALRLDHLHHLKLKGMDHDT